MKILVIGNGFDLEHGLPTKYKDFLDFIKTINDIFMDDWFNKDEKEYFCLISGPNGLNDTLRRYFLKHNFLNQLQENTQMKELIQLSKDNIWIKYFIENVEYKNQGWIDFESEISNVIQCFDYAKNLSNYLKKFNEWPSDRDREKNKEIIVEKIVEYTALKIKFFELVGKDLENIIKTINIHLVNLIRCLEIYLEDCIGKIEVEYTAPDIKDINFDKILSFNYTNTYEKIYSNNNDSIEYDYIHGKADIARVADDNNMVLGIDEYLDDEAKNKELEFIAFKKYFQRIYKKTGNTYKIWISEMKKLINYKLYSKDQEMDSTYDKETYDFLKQVSKREKYDSVNHIYIFGHSLDVTDKDIIKELIECENTVTTIFYYDKGVYAQQIANLVKIIGQDELIKRVSGANPTIIFKQQQQRIGRN